MKPRFSKQTKATIYMPAEVYGSIRLLVDTQDLEVAWFGDITVSNPDPQNLSLSIDKVYLYPQTVSSAAVHEATPGDGYDDWYTNRIVEAQGKPIMQYYGHSHVNMGVTPSGTDIDYRDQQGKINVFSIHNKKGNEHWEIWTEDYIYEDGDITIVITGSQLANTEEMVKRYKPPVQKAKQNIKHAKDYGYTAPKTTSYNNYDYGYTDPKTTSYNNYDYGYSEPVSFSLNYSYEIEECLKEEPAAAYIRQELKKGNYTSAYNAAKGELLREIIIQDQLDNMMETGGLSMG